MDLATFVVIVAAALLFAWQIYLSHQAHKAYIEANNMHLARAAETNNAHLSRATLDRDAWMDFYEKNSHESPTVDGGDDADLWKREQ